MFSTRFITQRKELSVAIALLCFSSSPSLAGVFQPIGVDKGDVYHLMFTTAGQRDAASRELADYYAFVSQEAAVSGLTEDVTWSPLVSVLRPDAIDDESIDARSFIEISGPIYNMNGELFSSNGLFGSDENSPVIPAGAPNYDQFGQELNVSYGVATGTRVDGIGQDPLGAGRVTVGTNNNWNMAGNWLIVDDEPETQLYHYYAVSEPITAVPEPSGIGLLAFGLTFSLRRKRRCLKTRRA